MVDRHSKNTMGTDRLFFSGPTPEAIAGSSLTPIYVEQEICERRSSVSEKPQTTRTKQRTYVDILLPMNTLSSRPHHLHATNRTATAPPPLILFTAPPLPHLLSPCRTSTALHLANNLPFFLRLSLSLSLHLSLALSFFLSLFVLSLSLSLCQALSHQKRAHSLSTKAGTAVSSSSVDFWLSSHAFSAIDLSMTVGFHSPSSLVSLGLFFLSVNAHPDILLPHNCAPVLTCHLTNTLGLSSDCRSKSELDLIWCRSTDPAAHCSLTRAEKHGRSLPQTCSRFQITSDKNSARESQQKRCQQQLPDLGLK